MKTSVVLLIILLLFLLFAAVTAGCPPSIDPPDYT
jgi:hypothetical protein